MKEKKEKAEKREKLEKLKEKKEKKEKKKEKDANKKNTVRTWLVVSDDKACRSMSTMYLSLQKEDKNPEAVPKITLKLGTASPRPATPDNAPMKKM